MIISDLSWVSLYLAFRKFVQCKDAIYVVLPWNLISTNSKAAMRKLHSQILQIYEKAKYKSYHFDFINYSIVWIIVK